VAARTDPHSGQPEAKATPATIAPIGLAFRGFARLPMAAPQGAPNREPEWPPGTWWTRVAAAEGFEYRLATSRGPLFWHDFAYRRLGSNGSLAEHLDGQVYRAAAFVDERLDGCLSIGPEDPALQPGALGLSPADALEGGAARILKTQIFEYYIAETETVVCACFQVGIEAVRKALACGAAKSVEDIGRTLGAGTNCGSCLPELKRIMVHECSAHPPYPR
jgi:assimilatory nitrate reductase catalytic subunit